MDLSYLPVILAMGPPPQPGQPAAPAWTSLVPLVLLVVVFYFVLIRPQQKKAKEHQQLPKPVKPGDKVATSGGILGVVVTVKEKTTLVERRKDERGNNTTGMLRLARKEFAKIGIDASSVFISSYRYE